MLTSFICAEHDCAIRCSWMGCYFNDGKGFGDENALPEPEEPTEHRRDPGASLDEGKHHINV